MRQRDPKLWKIAKKNITFFCSTLNIPNGHQTWVIWISWFDETLARIDLGKKKLRFFFAFLTFLDLGGTRGISEFPEKPVLMLLKNYWAFYNPKGSAKITDLRNFVVFMPISQNWPKTATFWKNWGINITLKIVIFWYIIVMVIVYSHFTLGKARYNT